MVPARNILRRHYDTYGGGCFDIDPPHVSKPPALPSSLRSNLMMMAEYQPSTTGAPAQEQTTDQQQEQEEAAESAQEQLEAPAATAGTSAKTDDSWLQLRIGLGTSSSSSSAPPRPSVQLELFSDRPPSSSTSSLRSSRPSGPPMFSSMASLPQLGYRQPPPWGFWSSNLMQYHMGGSSSSSSAPPPLMMLPPPQFYNVQRFPLTPPPPPPQQAGVGSGGPRFGELRVVSPPASVRQQHAGVWFLLRASENQ